MSHSYLIHHCWTTPIFAQLLPSCSPSCCPSIRPEDSRKLPHNEPQSSAQAGSASPAPSKSLLLFPHLLLLLARREIGTPYLPSPSPSPPGRAWPTSLINSIFNKNAEVSLCCIKPGHGPCVLLSVQKSFTAAQPAYRLEGIDLFCPTHSTAC